MTAKFLGIIKKLLGDDIKVPEGDGTFQAAP
jgi:hypothetical protein